MRQKFNNHPEKRNDTYIRTFIISAVMALKADRSHLGTQRHLTRQNWYISKPTGSHVSLSYQRQVKDLAQSQQTAAGVRLRMDECLWVNSWLAGGEEQTEGEEGRKSCLCPSVCVHVGEGQGKGERTFDVCCRLENMQVRRSILVCLLSDSHTFTRTREFTFCWQNNLDSWSAPCLH